MKEEIQKLYELQQIDLEMLRLREQLILYPPMLKKIETNMGKKKKEHEKLLEKRKALQKSRRDMEKEIEFLEEQVNKKLRQQLAPKIKQDAYDALKHEIDGVQKQISQFEDKILANITEEEKLEKSIAQGEQRLKAEEEDALMEQERINSQIESKKKRLASLEKDRNAQKNLVSQQLLSYYNRFYKSYGPNIVVKIEGDSCGGCHMRILPQVLVEIHRGDKIVHCEGCRRILMASDS